MSLVEKFKLKYEKTKIERQKFISALNPWSFDFMLSTWFGSGLIIPAPGTWGTIGGMIFAIPLLTLTSPSTVLITGAVLFALGLYSVSRLEKKLADHDPSFIVIDEVAAILLLIGTLSLSNINWSWLSYGLGFILFRFFDAKKPWLIGLADKKIKGAMGVMIDDIIAAVFAYISCIIVLILLSILVIPISAVYLGTN